MVRDCQVELVEWATCIVEQVQEELPQQDGFKAQIADGYGSSYGTQAQQIRVVERLASIEVRGEVRVKALVPGDQPKVQVKLALPEDYDQFSVHPMTLRATK